MSVAADTFAAFVGVLADALERWTQQGSSTWAGATP